MGIREIIGKLMNREKEEQEELDDDETRDLGLRSLRRQRRVQMEEIEKEQLKEKILEFQRVRERRMLGGIKDKSEKKKQLIDKISKRKQINTLGEKNLMIKTIKLKKRAGNKQQGSSWLNKTNL